MRSGSETLDRVADLAVALRADIIVSKRVFGSGRGDVAWRVLISWFDDGAFRVATGSDCRLEGAFEHVLGHVKTIRGGGEPGQL
jgi:hypothetical protein